MLLQHVPCSTSPWLLPVPTCTGYWMMEGAGGGLQLGRRRIAAAKIARKSEKTSERCLCANNIPQRTLLNYMILTVKQTLPLLLLPSAPLQTPPPSIMPLVVVLLCCCFAFAQVEIIIFSYILCNTLEAANTATPRPPVSSSITCQPTPYRHLSVVWQRYAYFFSSIPWGPV